MDLGDALELFELLTGGSLPRGLCADRTPHQPHLYESQSLGKFMCTADQLTREPWRSEQRRLRADWNWRQPS